MEHFYQNIQGWFFAEALYREAVESARDGDVFVEVGAWKGKSTAFMAVEIENSGKGIKFITVDHFLGSKEHQNDPAIQGGTLLAEFRENTCDLPRQVMIMDSVVAAKQFEDNSLAFVYLDASHDYESVLADIKAWWPKIKKGGVLAGDDWKWGGVRYAVKRNFPDSIHISGIYPQWRVSK
jgi:cephalosporin hydroxylase